MLSTAEIAKNRVDEYVIIKFLNWPGTARNLWRFRESFRIDLDMFLFARIRFKLCCAVVANVARSWGIVKSS